MKNLREFLRIVYLALSDRQNIVVPIRLDYGSAPFGKEFPKKLGAVRWRASKPHIKYSPKSIRWAVCSGCRTVRMAFNRWNDERRVNVDRNDNDWNDNWWFGGRRNFLW